MVEPSFPTPQAAEEAFYAALEKRDLECMMNVWAASEEVTCIHPGGGRLVGHESVRESWRQIFAGESQLRFRVTNQHYLRGPTFAVHIVYEEITIAQERRRALVVATNAYQLTERGWRMILHHASLSPEAPGKSESVPSGQTLH